MATSVLLVEDEPGIADALVYALQSEGFVTRWHATGLAALDDHRRRPADFVVLDVGLPDINGFELCRALRRSSDVPILFLTARNAEVDRIVGLEIGADDYVTKPFSPREVTARVRAILRRTRATSLEAGPSNITSCSSELAHDEDGKRFVLAGKSLVLTRYEYRLLAVLTERPGRVFSRDELMERVWEDPGASLDRTVDAHIKALRAKLRREGGETMADCIVTHRGLGYSWQAP